MVCGVYKMKKSIYLVVDYEVNLQECVHVTLIYYEKYFWIVNPKEKSGKKASCISVYLVNINETEVHF